jgi:hypothetical protein
MAWPSAQATAHASSPSAARSAPTSRSWPCGISVPIKVQLLDYTGKNLSASTIVLALSTPALSPSPSPGAQPSGTFTFMPTGDSGPMYQYNVKTTGYPKHTYTLSFTVYGDPVTHTVQFVIG